MKKVNHHQISITIQNKTTMHHPNFQKSQIPNVLSSQYPLFKDTDVPLDCLFLHLAQGYTTDLFLQDFPTVTAAQVEEALELAIEIFKMPEVLLLAEDGNPKLMPAETRRRRDNEGSATGQF